jgi:hypothetical protein
MAVLQNESDFLRVVEDLGEESRGRLLDAGYFTLNHFAILAETRAGVRAVLRTECNIDNNWQLTIVIACWEIGGALRAADTRTRQDRGSRPPKDDT